MSVSVLTIVKNRADHLAQLVEGLRRSTVCPVELIIADMGSDPPIAASTALFPVRVIRLETDDLPLAMARNTAADMAAGSHLLFLDVDCIPMRDLVGAMGSRLASNDSVICAEAFYLGPNDARVGWSEELLKRTASPHPLRAFPAYGLREEVNPGLFWSLVFGIRRATFQQLGGFDEAFTGYGAEDTDFGFRAQRAGVPLHFMGSAGVFHQHHRVLDPPLQHVRDIVRNAITFHARWGFWPMEGWLAAFRDMELVDWSNSELTLRRLPTDNEWETARNSGKI